jgi:hypothetical protein
MWKLKVLPRLVSDPVPAGQPLFYMSSDAFHTILLPDNLALIPYGTNSTAIADCYDPVKSLSLMPIASWPSRILTGVASTSFGSRLVGKVKCRLFKPDPELQLNVSSSVTIRYANKVATWQHTFGVNPRACPNGTVSMLWWLGIINQFCSPQLFS